MYDWQRAILFLLSIFSFLVFVEGYHECKAKRNAYKPTYELFPLGIFVWGDAVIFGLLWFGMSLVSLYLNDWILFSLLFWVFWLVRSVGETIYWFNQQFSKVVRQKPESLPGYSIFQNDSIWFVYQIVCQSITVVSLTAVIYIASLWISRL